MKDYEIMYVVKPVEDQKLESVVNKFNTLIEDNGGKVEKTDRWGKKRR